MRKASREDVPPTRFPPTDLTVVIRDFNHHARIARYWNATHLRRRAIRSDATTSRDPMSRGCRSPRRPSRRRLRHRRRWNGPKCGLWRTCDGLWCTVRPRFRRFRMTTIPSDPTATCLRNRLPRTVLARDRGIRRPSVYRPSLRTCPFNGQCSSNLSHRPIWRKF